MTNRVAVNFGSSNLLHGISYLNMACREDYKLIGRRAGEKQKRGWKEDILSAY
jgi:hypothetical protein